MFNIIKQASIELNKPDLNIVKVAGVVQRLVNWFRKLNDKEYREQVEKLKYESSAIYDYLKYLAKHIELLQKAIKDADVNLYEKELDEVKYLSAKLSEELNSLSQSANEASVVEDKPESKAVEAELYGKVNKNFRDVFGNYQILFSQKAKDLVKNKLIAVTNQFPPEDPRHKLINDNTILNNFFIALEESIKNGVVEEIYPVKKEGREKQTYVKARSVPFSVPGVNLKITSSVLLNYIPTRGFSFMRLLGLNFEDIVTSSKNNEIVKEGFVEEVKLKPVSSYPNKHLWARDVIRIAFKKLMGRYPTRQEEQMAQAVGLLESHYGAGWKGVGAGSNNWGAVQCCKPKDGKCPSGTFMYEDSTPKADGSSKKYSICFKSYQDPVDGAYDMLKHIFKSSYKNRGQKTQWAASMGSIPHFSAAMYDTTYYQGFGPDRETRIKNHAKYMDKLVNNISKHTNTERAVSANIQTIPSEQETEQMKSEQREQVANVDSLLNYLFANKLNTIIKNAILKNELTSNNFVINIKSNDDVNYKIKYAELIKNIIEYELDSEASIHYDDNDIKVFCEISGDKRKAIDAVTSIISIASVAFQNKYNKILSASVKEGFCDLKKISFKEIEKTDRFLILRGMV